MCVGFHNWVTPSKRSVCKEAEEIISYIILCSKCSCEQSTAPPYTEPGSGRYGTGDGELHGARGEAKGVPGYALVSALVSHTQVLNGEGPILADVELATLCDLDALLLHQQKREAVSEHGMLPTSPTCSANPGMDAMNKCGHQMLALLFQRNQRGVQGHLFLMASTVRSSTPQTPTDTSQRHPTGHPMDTPQTPHRTPHRNTPQTSHTNRLAGTSPRP